jgi:hypothetical protein
MPYCMGSLYWQLNGIHFCLFHVFTLPVAPFALPFAPSHLRTFRTFRTFAPFAPPFALPFAPSHRLSHCLSHRLSSRLSCLSCHKHYFTYYFPCVSFVSKFLRPSFVPTVSSTSFITCDSCYPSLISFFSNRYLGRTLMVISRV